MGIVFIRQTLKNLYNIGLPHEHHACHVSPVHATQFPIGVLAIET